LIAVKSRDGFKNGPTSQWGEYLAEIDISGASPSVTLPEDILWAIATKNGTRDYVNPHNSGKVKVTVSSNLFGRSVSEVVSRNNGLNFITQNHQGGWVAIDFDPKGIGNWICPNTFFVGHGYRTSSAYRLRNFSLQGSNGKTVNSGPWQDLVTINNSIVIPSPASNIWSHKISIPGLDYKVDRFRFIRLLQTGTNASNNWILAVGNWLLGGQYRVL